MTSRSPRGLGKVTENEENTEGVNLWLGGKTLKKPYICLNLNSLKILFGDANNDCRNIE